MSSEITVLNEIVQEQRAHIAQLVSQIEDLKLQFDLVLNERNEAMDESASAKCVHGALVRNLTSMSEFAGKAMRERDEARRERDEARLQMGRILNEIDCRIEHGAESNGHLEAIYNLFKENSNV